MAGLFGLLDLGSGALTAQRAGVATSGRNLANINTEGYSRESVSMLSQLGPPTYGGVRSGAITRAGSEMLFRRERSAASTAGQSSARSEALLDVERSLVVGGTDVMQAIATLFGGLLDLTAAPGDTSLRGQVVNQARSVANAIRRSFDAVRESQADIDSRIAALSKQASTLAAEVAAFNRIAASESDPAIFDKRDLAARKLAEITGGQARIDTDGMMRVVAGGGTVLVDGMRAVSLRTTADPAYGGHLRIDAVDGTHVADVTGLLDGGRLGGEISARDGELEATRVALDQLAFDLATQFNTTHAAGLGLDGVSGRNLFTAPAAVAGAAAGFDVDPTVLANPSFLAASAVGTGPGNSDNLIALIDLRDLPLAGGGSRTFVEEAARILGSIGQAASAARADHAVDAARVEVVQGVRDAVTGVSTEEELARLTQFQYASEAATRFLSTVDELLGDLIRNL